MKMKVVVLGARHYDFTNKDTGERIVGDNIYYTDLLPENEDGTNGVAISKSGIKESFVRESNLYRIPLPAVFEIEFSARKSISGKASLEMVKFEHVREFPLSIDSKK